MFLLLFLVVSVSAKRLPNIYWNSTNPIFDVSNTDHVISTRIDDRVSIYCPEPNEESDYEFSAIYMVSEEEYTHCVLLKPHLIGSCNNSTRQVSIGIVFRHFSPVPGGLEFVPGETYYMITTSDGSREGFDRKKGGLCKDRQMKLKFEVSPKKGSINLKFAARTLTRENPRPTTPIMYIIHGEDETEVVEDDDDGSSPLMPLCSILFCLLLTLL